MSDPTLESDTAAGCELCAARHETLALQPRIGRAFVECWRCGRHVLVPGVTEWDFHDPYSRRRIVWRRATFALGAGFVVPFVHLAVTLTTPRTWTALEALLSLAAGWLVAGLLETALFLGEIARSRRRVAGDPMYQAKLVEQCIAESRADRAPLTSPPGLDASVESAEPERPGQHHPA